MKYENFHQVKAIVAQIDTHRKTISQLECAPEVSINSEFNRVYTIGTTDGCEHDYTAHARLFIENIITDLRRRVAELEAKLKPL